MTDIIELAKTAIALDLEAIQDPTPAFAMRHFVVGQHDTDGQQWAQCVLELQNRLMAIATSDIDAQIAELRIERLEKRGTAISMLKARKHKIELKQVELARLGTIRGISHLLAIKQQLEESHGGRGWTREELDAEQPEYWRRRLMRQAELDVMATGRIGVGNQDALRMARLPYPGSESFVDGVQSRFLEADKTRLLVAIPTMIDRDKINSDGLRCLEGWTIPNTVERKVYVIQGKPVADAYTDAALTALSDGATHILCVEDDHIIPAGTFEKLWRLHHDSGPKSIVSAWYAQRVEPRRGTPIVVRDGRREYLEDDGNVHEVHTIPQGFTIIPVSIFRDIPQPWFVTTSALSQDSFFSQLAREAGYKLLVDTSARIKHVDRETNAVYE